MPSFWNRMGLAVAFMVPISSGPVSIYAQTPPCGAIQYHPCAEPPGRAHVAPSEIPAPPDMPPDMPPSVTPPGLTTMPDLTAPETPFAAAEPGLGTADVAFNTPNMMGDLLRAYRGVTFQYLLAGDQATVNSSGAVMFRNTSIAENNSAVPRDRVFMRYNYFHNALDVRGLKPAGTEDFGQTFVGLIPGQTAPNFDNPDTFSNPFNFAFGQALPPSHTAIPAGADVAVIDPFTGLILGVEQAENLGIPTANGTPVSQTMVRPGARS
jgi:hypothetical protein